MKPLRIVDLSRTLVPGQETRHLELNTYFMGDSSLIRYYPDLKDYAPKHKDEYYKMQVLSMADHIGTHIEMPAHYKPDGWDGSTFPLERLAHEAVIVDISKKKPGEQIEVNDLSDVQEGDIVLLKTGGGTVPFSEKAVELLISKKVSAIGTDGGVEITTIIREGKEVPLPTHTILLRENNIPIIEGLTNIDKLTKNRVFLLALPLKIKGLEASPIRAIAIEEE